MLRYESENAEYFANFLVGIVKDTASTFFNIHVEFSRLPEMCASKLILWKITQTPIQVEDSTNPPSTKVDHSLHSCRLQEFPEVKTCPFQHMHSNNLSKRVKSRGLDKNQLEMAFPYHIIFASDLTILQHGDKLADFIGLIPDPSLMNTIFDLVNNDYDWQDWKSFRRLAHGNSMQLKCKFILKSIATHPIRLVGQILFAEDETATFLCFPDVTEAKEMQAQGITLNQLSSHNKSIESIILHEHIQSETETGQRFSEMKMELERDKAQMALLQATAESAESALAMKRTFVRYVR